MIFCICQVISVYQTFCLCFGVNFDELAKKALDKQKFQFISQLLNRILLKADQFNSFFSNILDSDYQV